MAYSPAHELLLSNSSRLALHHSTAVVAIRAETAQGLACGSAVVVQIEDRFWLVTARHIVTGARAANVKCWFVEAMKKGEGRTLPLHDLELSDDEWVVADDDDLAVAPLPIGQLPTDHLVSGIYIDRFGYASMGPNPDLTLIGRWGEAEERNLIVTRRGVLATLQRPKVKYEIGPGKIVENEMYLVDATVMRGMSGGAVFNEVNPPMVLGLVSAHQRIVSLPPAVAQLPESARQAAEAIWNSLGPINAGMVYVVPFDRVAAFVRAVDKESHVKP